MTVASQNQMSNRMKTRLKMVVMPIRHLKLLLALTLLFAAHAQEPPAPVTPSPDRRQGEGEGPFDRMVIRGITMIDGTGAPPRGPVDIGVEGNRIREVKSVGVPGSPIDAKGRPAEGS